MFYLSCLIAYLLGSIPFGFLLAKLLKGIDIREHGSHNIGATNAFRVLGKPWGILVFFLDALKGTLAVLLYVYLFDSNATVQLKLILAVIAILGHTFPVWLSFKGGKGIATSLGVFLAVTPWPTLTTFLLWALVFSITRILSLASLVAALLFPVLVFAFTRTTPGFTALFVISLLLMFFIFFTHRANISRLLKGEEKKLF